MATYGWAILVVMVAIGALAYFGVLDLPQNMKSSDNTTIPIDLEEEAVFACQNLDKDGNVYPPVITIRNALVSDGLNIPILKGDEARAEGHDERGVMCHIPILVCNHPSYCINAEMVIPVNYSVWEPWFVGGDFK